MSLLLDTSASIEFTEVYTSSSLSNLQVVTAVKYLQDQQQALSDSSLPLEVQTTGGNSEIASDIPTLTLITPSYYSNINTVMSTSTNGVSRLNSMASTNTDYKSLKFISLYMVFLFATGILAL
ncbi:hypothetical protein DFJ63DRAFT_332932 [Scheffersomyces coipomensis]|uniref:uncharacterized protein n=1 Tax=Scheffersomyces coipomensis TaxID=1788519 RepID=UPI00315DB9D0